jgi:hypothetical protein
MWEILTQSILYSLEFCNKVYKVFESIVNSLLDAQFTDYWLTAWSSCQDLCGNLFQSGILLPDLEFHF